MSAFKTTELTMANTATCRVDAHPVPAGRGPWAESVEAGSGKLAWKFQTGGERRFTASGIHGIIPKTEMMPIPLTYFSLRLALANGT